MERNQKETLTREYIYQAFAMLLKEKPYDSISVCDITDKAGVSRMSFYRNFKSKEDLTFKAIETVTNKLRIDIDNLPIKNLYSITKIIFELLECQKKIIKSFENADITRTLVTLAIEKIQQDSPHDKINRANKYLPLYYFGALSSVAQEWLKNDCQESPEEMAKFFSNMINDEPLNSHESL